MPADNAHLVVAELSQRVERLRLVLLIPALLLAALVFFPAYFVFTEAQVAVQFAAGNEVAVYAPYLSAALAMAVVSGLWTIVFAVYRGIRRRRLRAWRAELIQRYRVEASEVDDLAAIFY